jgi:hypothetical protein
MHPSDSPDCRVAPAHAVPPAATDEIDAIIEAVSADEPFTRGRDARRDTIAPSLASSATTRSTRRASMRSAVSRLVIPTIFAFVCGSLIAVWAVRLLERRAQIQRSGTTSRRAPDTTETLAPKSVAESPVGKEARVGAAQAPSPAPIAARRAWPTMGPLARAIAASPSPSRIASVRRSAPPDHRRAQVAPSVAIAIPPTPRANKTDRSDGAPPLVWSAPSNDVATRDSTAIIGSLPVADADPAVPPIVPGGAAAPAARGGEADAVRQTIAKYETAIDQMNVGAAAAVFPSVDTVALTRAFSALKEQSVDFERCDVALMTATATVRCLGTAHYVVKVGAPTPRRRRYEWIFTLEKVGNAWKIDDMATTTIGRPLAQR